MISYVSGRLSGILLMKLKLLKIEACEYIRCFQACYVRSGQVLWTCKGRNKTFPPSTSLLVMGEVAGVNTASLGGYLHSPKTSAKWAEGFHNELNGHMFDLHRYGFRQVVLCPWLTVWWKQAAMPYRIGRRSGQQGPRHPPYTRTEVSSMLLEHHRRFVEETTSPQAHGTQGHEGLPGNSGN